MLLSYGILKGLNPYIERVCFLFETVFRKYKQIHFIYIDGWRIFFSFSKTIFLFFIVIGCVRNVDGEF